MASERFLTTDHDRIRRWAEERDGTPSAVSETGGGADPGISRATAEERDDVELGVKAA